MLGEDYLRCILKSGKVRACGRSILKLKDFDWSWHANVELVEVDVLNIDSLRSACQGCDGVYYLVHSMNAQQKNFSKADREAAQNMIQAAEIAGLKRIIYLGGLGDDDKNLSHHLRSRMEVSNIIQSGKVPATTLRAAMIIGKGSVSFEILRALVKNLPIMITPRWVSTESQPIAVTNVLNYLVGCLESDKTTGQIFDSGRIKEPRGLSRQQDPRNYPAEFIRLSAGDSFGYQEGTNMKKIAVMLGILVSSCLFFTF